MSDTPQITPNEFNQLLANQAKELEVKQNQLVLQAQADKHSFEYSKAIIEANERDRKEERNHKAKTDKARYIYSGVIIALFIAFLSYALHLGEKELASEIIKILFYGSFGGMGGYAIKAVQVSSKEDKKSDDN